MIYIEDIRCNDICVVDNEIWFSNADMNGLYKKKLNKAEAEFISFFPCEKLWQSQLHGKIIRYGNRLVFTPLLADMISIYDIFAGDFRSYKIDWESEGNDEKIVFFWSVLNGTYIYMFGNNQPCILKFNIEDGGYTFINSWFEEFQKFGYKRERELFSERGIKIDADLYLYTKQNNLLIQFDLNSEKFFYYVIGNKEDRFVTAEYSNGNFWLLNMQSELLEWNKDKGIIKRIKVNVDSAYYRSIRNGNCIIFLPSGNGKTAFCVNTLTESIEWKGLIESSAQVLSEMPGSIIFYSKKNSTVYRMNGQEWQVVERLCINSFEHSMIIWNKIEKNKMVQEDEHWRLDNFLTILSDKRLLIEESKQDNSQIGNIIYEKGF